MPTEHIDDIPAKASSLVTDQETISTNIKSTNGKRYPIKRAKGPKDFSKAIFTFCPLSNLLPVLITSIILLSTSDTEQVALVWQDAHPETFIRLTLIILGVMSLTIPQCSIELLYFSAAMYSTKSRKANV